MKPFLNARFIIFCAIVGLVFLCGSLHAAVQNIKIEAVEDASDIFYDYDCFTGAISGERVNVRASADTSSEVICQLDKGDGIFVVGEKDKWYKMKLPKKARVYVNKASVSKKDGESIIKEDNVNIRTAATISSSVVGQLSKGSAVKVVREYLDWYEIEAPNVAYGWVCRDYVRKKGEVVSRPPSFSEELAKLDEAYKAELNKPPRQIELKWLLDEYQKFSVEHKGSPEAETALNHASEVKLKIAELEHLKAKEEYEARLKNISSPRPGEEPIATGIVANVGRIAGRLSQFKLIKDKRFIAYLKSDKVDLNRYVNLNVTVWGVKKDVKGTSLFEVEAVQPIQ